MIVSLKDFTNNYLPKSYNENIFLPDRKLIQNIILLKELELSIKFLKNTGMMFI